MYIKVYTKEESTEVGENLFDLSTSSDYYLDVTDPFNPVEADADNKLSDYIAVEPNTLYKYEVNVTPTDYPYWTGWYFYKSTTEVSSYIPHRQINSSWNERSKCFYIKTPQDANYIRIGSRYLGQSGATVKFIKMSPVTYSYYDTIYDIGSPKTVNTLNGINKFSCTVPLNSSKMSPELVQFMNQIEFYDDNDILRFGGFLVDRTIKMPDITLNCYGYGYIFQKMRTNAKEYSERTYSKLMNAVFDEYIADNNHLSLGFTSELNITDTKTTTRLLKDDDFVYDKMIEWANDCGGYLLFDVDKSVKFQYEVPQDRMWYAKWEYNEESNILDLPTSFNNMITFPQVAQSIIDTVNNMYNHKEITEGEITMNVICNANDVSSIERYGMLDGVASINDSVVVRETIYEKTNSQLEEVYLVQNNMSFELADSILAPIDEMKVGQKITVFIEPYFNFKTTATILEIQRDYMSATVNLTVGTTLYRQNKPTIVNYK